jgi:ABC-type branched-subunit amino acid transport system substrate-binding protein
VPTSRCAAFIRAARKAGFGGTFYNVSFVGTKALADELGTDARGVVVSQVMPYPYSPVSLLSGEYLAAGQAAGKDFEPNYSSIEGYVAAKTFSEALRRAGSAVTRGHADRSPGVDARAQPWWLLCRLQCQQPAHRLPLRGLDDPDWRRQGPALSLRRARTCRARGFPA